MEFGPLCSQAGLKKLSASRAQRTVDLRPTPLGPLSLYRIVAASPRLSIRSRTLSLRLAFGAVSLAIETPFRSGHMRRIHLGLVTAFALLALPAAQGQTATV